MMGQIAESRNQLLKNNFINWFIKKYHVDLTEAEIENANQYINFNDFFTRKLKPGVRTFSQDKKAIISPVDGAIYQFGKIDNDQIIQAKGRKYSANELLAGDNALTKKFIDGDFITLYLAPKDYHRIHLPLDASLEQMIYVPGKLFSVNPHSARTIPNLFARNERVICIFKTEIGSVAVILVGAMIVASMYLSWHGVVNAKRKNIIQNFNYPELINLNRADELGYFKLGSTVILLFQKNKIKWDDMINQNQPIKMGQTIAEII
jgi:phosphatidylserine decarboxylase